MIAPVDGSGSWPAWIAFVENFMIPPIWIPTGSAVGGKIGSGVEPEEPLAGKREKCGLSFD